MQIYLLRLMVYKKVSQKYLTNVAVSEDQHIYRSHLS